MNNVDKIRRKVLAEAGLNQSEQDVYLTGLSELGHTSAGLINKTRLPRPTVLAALKTLRDMELCEVHRRDGRSFLYLMRPPEALKVHLGRQVRYLDGLIGQIDTLDLGAHTGLTVRTVEGQTGLEELLELALRCKSRQWHIIAPRSNAIAFMPTDYIAYFKRVRTERQILSQTLWEPARKGEKIALKDVLMRKPRYLPDNLGKEIPSLMLAFDDMLLIVTGTKHPSATLIKNNASANTFRLLFELSWRSCRS